MRYIFIVQGNGRGHITQAIALYEMLVKNGHQVVAVLVGKSPQREIPDFLENRIKAPIETFDSPNFQTNSKDKQSTIYKSAALSFLYLRKYIKSIHFINAKIKEHLPDAVINFYDLVAGMTYALYKPKIPMFCIAHQYLFLHPDYKFPPKRKQQVEMLKIYTRFTGLGAFRLLALSFTEKRDLPEKNIYIIPPLLRRELENHKSKEENFFLGYVVNSGFASEVNSWHAEHPQIPLHFFWDKKNVEDLVRVDDTLSFHKINDCLFLKYMSKCKAYATTGGFESVCEAIYYQKPVMMVPAHIEQECNAHEAQGLGIGIASKKFDLSGLQNFLPQYKPYDGFHVWVNQSEQKILKLLEDTDCKNQPISHIQEPAASYLLRFRRFVVNKVSCKI